MTHHHSQPRQQSDQYQSVGPVRQRAQPVQPPPRGQPVVTQPPFQQPTPQYQQPQPAQPPAPQTHQPTPQYQQPVRSQPVPQGGTTQPPTQPPVQPPPHQQVSPQPIPGTRAQIRAVEAGDEYVHVRIRNPDAFETIRTPDWAARAADSIREGSEVRTGKLKGSDEWSIQSVLLRKPIDSQTATRDASRIVRKIEG